MKWLMLGLGTAAVLVGAAAGIAAAVKIRRPARPADCVDGGVRHWDSGDSAPKVILSREITEFRCTFSLFASEKIPGLPEGGLYTCRARREDGAVLCSIDWRKRTEGSGSRAFTADEAFLARLQEIVLRHDLARHNGYCCRVSGLPDMYGATLDVRYASGESIYAHDNQNQFLASGALKDLYDLFTAGGTE